MTALLLVTLWLLAVGFVLCLMRSSADADALWRDMNLAMEATSGSISTNPVQTVSAPAWFSSDALDYNQGGRNG